MKKLGIVSFLSLGLFACGGGSSSDSTPSTPAPIPTPSNSAPTLTGSLVLSVPANVIGSLVVDVADEDGDTITATTNSVDWVALEITDGQLTLTANPSVFDLGDNTIEIELSDGTDTSTYAVTINVQDNPSSYTFQPIDDTFLLGSWQLSDSRDIVFGGAQGFVASSPQDIQPFNWSVDNDQITIESKRFGCMEHCDTLSEWSIQVIEQESDGRLALRLTGSAINDQTLIGTPNSTHTLAEGYYGEMSKSSGEAFFTSDPEFNIGFQVSYRSPSSSLSFFDTFEVLIEDEGNGQLAVSLPDNPPEGQTVDLRFETVSGLANQSVELVSILTELEVENTSQGLAVFTGIVELQLADEDNLAFPIEEYIGLEEALAEKMGVVGIYTKLQSTEFPELEQDDVFMLTTQYTSRETEELANFGKLRITGSETASIELAILDPVESKNEVHEGVFSVEGNLLTLTINNQALTYRLFTNNFGQLVSVSQQVFSDGSRLRMYPFTKMSDVNLTEDDVVGAWENQAFVNILDEGPELTLFSPSQQLERSYLYSFAASNDDFYRIEDGNIIKLLRGYQCVGATNYDECEQIVLQNAMSNEQITVYTEQLEIFDFDGERFQGTRTLRLKACCSDDVLLGAFSRTYVRAEEAILP